jgi:hypothetical protein
MFAWPHPHLEQVRCTALAQLDGAVFSQRPGDVRQQRCGPAVLQHRCQRRIRCFCHDLRGVQRNTVMGALATACLAMHSALHLKAMQPQHEQMPHCIVGLQLQQCTCAVTGMPEW